MFSHPEFQIDHHKVERLSELMITNKNSTYLYQNVLIVIVFVMYIVVHDEHLFILFTSKMLLDSRMIRFMNSKKPLIICQFKH